MNLCRGLTVMARLMDALNLHRKTVMLSLSHEGLQEPKRTRKNSPVSSPSSNSTSVAHSLSSSRVIEGILDVEKAIMPFVRDAVLQVIEQPLDERERDTLSSSKSVRCHTNREKTILNGSTIMEGRRFVSLDLSCSRFSTSFSRCDLSAAIFTDAFASHSTFNMASMRHCNLTHVQFHSCTFLATDATDVCARHGRFSHCIFSRTDMRRWDVRGATFYRCSFSMCDMSNWTYDGQTLVVEPIGWGNNRRLRWNEGAEKDQEVIGCHVIGNPATNGGPSLPPRDPTP
ncbi:putative Pentapeptide repeats (8 copies) Pentapeptide repeats (9 copies) [Trypanosoma vivax]|uniref:Pentapeptide repeat-containing protein n=1 Tax=Trypanosoma vivax (strain Y486) TaxID=1055687 RepID=G0U735_TRYVY|nr:hypothetical protein TRVL_01278 [Trypanosoma vivax]KAH8611262.1 putative Pentapeptide repeats (8 copies) Pentapeptide repeats (9 copies) [Trypanosoma vivax]CCC51692.1 conserved hypothetical protein [Trypanosoma vivax Y486]